jgi:site-specific DNA-methyltransferase (adenine-specific)
MLLIAHQSDGRILWGDNRAPVPNIYSEMPPRNRAHPNEKPVSLLSWVIENHSRKGTNILDPFMGSGTTLVACKKLGRQGIGIEIDPEYFEIACKRVEDAARQPDLFVETPSAAPKQGSLL